MNNAWESSREAAECRLNYLSHITARFLLRVNILHVPKLPEKPLALLLLESQRRTQQAHVYTNFTSSNAPRNLIKFNDLFFPLLTNELWIIVIRVHDSVIINFACHLVRAVYYFRMKKETITILVIFTAAFAHREISIWDGSREMISCIRNEITSNSRR